MGGMFKDSNAFLTYLFVPYFRVNNLTKKYGSEFQELYSENGFYSDIEYLKVFQYRDEKVNIQSASGTADRFMWPYYF